MTSYVDPDTADQVYHLANQGFAEKEANFDGFLTAHAELTTSGAAVSPRTFKRLFEEHYEPALANRVFLAQQLRDIWGEYDVLVGHESEDEAVEELKETGDTGAIAKNKFDDLLERIADVIESVTPRVDWGKHHHKNYQEELEDWLQEKYQDLDYTLSDPSSMTRTSNLATVQECVALAMRGVAGRRKRKPAGKPTPLNPKKRKLLSDGELLAGTWWGNENELLISSSAFDDVVKEYESYLVSNSRPPTGTYEHRANMEDFLKRGLQALNFEPDLGILDLYQEWDFRDSKNFVRTPACINPALDPAQLRHGVGEYKTVFGSNEVKQFLGGGVSKAELSLIHDLNAPAGVGGVAMVASLNAKRSLEVNNRKGRLLGGGGAGQPDIRLRDPEELWKQLLEDSHYPPKGFYQRARSGRPPMVDADQMGSPLPRFKHAMESKPDEETWRKIKKEKDPATLKTMAARQLVILKDERERAMEFIYENPHHFTPGQPKLNERGGKDQRKLRYHGLRDSDFVVPIAHAFAARMTQIFRLTIYHKLYEAGECSLRELLTEHYTNLEVWDEHEQLYMELENNRWFSLQREKEIVDLETRYTSREKLRGEWKAEQRKIKKAISVIKKKPGVYKLVQGVVTTDAPSASGASADRGASALPTPITQQRTTPKSREPSSFESALEEPDVSPSKPPVTAGAIGVDPASSAMDIDSSGDEIDGPEEMDTDSDPGGETLGRTDRYNDLTPAVANKIIEFYKHMRALYEDKLKEAYQKNIYLDPADKGNDSFLTRNNWDIMSKHQVLWALDTEIHNMERVMDPNDKVAHGRGRELRWEIPKSEAFRAFVKLPVSPKRMRCLKSLAPGPLLGERPPLMDPRVIVAGSRLLGEEVYDGVEAKKYRYRMKDMSLPKKKPAPAPGPSATQGAAPPGGTTGGPTNLGTQAAPKGSANDQGTAETPKTTETPKAANATGTPKAADIAATTGTPKTTSLPKTSSPPKTTRAPETKSVPKIASTAGTAGTVGPKRVQTPKQTHVGSSADWSEPTASLNSSADRGRKKSVSQKPVSSIYLDIHGVPKNWNRMIELHRETWNETEPAGTALLTWDEWIEAIYETTLHSTRDIERFFPRGSPFKGNGEALKSHISDIYKNVFRKRFGHDIMYWREREHFRHDVLTNLANGINKALVSYGLDKSFQDVYPGLIDPSVDAITKGSSGPQEALERLAEARIHTEKELSLFKRQATGSESKRDKKLQALGLQGQYYEVLYQRAWANADPTTRAQVDGWYKKEKQELDNAQPTTAPATPFPGPSGSSGFQPPLPATRYPREQDPDQEGGKPLSKEDEKWQYEEDLGLHRYRELIQELSKEVQQSMPIAKAAAQEATRLQALADQNPADEEAKKAAEKAQKKRERLFHVYRTATDTLKLCGDALASQEQWGRRKAPSSEQLLAKYNQLADFDAWKNTPGEQKGPNSTPEGLHTLWVWELSNLIHNLWKSLGQNTGPDNWLYLQYLFWDRIGGDTLEKKRQVFLYTLVSQVNSRFERSGREPILPLPPLPPVEWTQEFATADQLLGKPLALKRNLLEREWNIWSQRRTRQKRKQKWRDERKQQAAESQAPPAPAPAPAPSRAPVPIPRPHSQPRPSVTGSLFPSSWPSSMAPPPPPPPPAAPSPFKTTTKPPRVVPLPPPPPPPPTPRAPPQTPRKRSWDGGSSLLTPPSTIKSTFSDGSPQKKGTLPPPARTQTAVEQQQGSGRNTTQTITPTTAAPTIAPTTAPIIIPPPLRPSQSRFQQSIFLPQRSQTIPPPAAPAAQATPGGIRPGPRRSPRVAQQQQQQQFSAPVPTTSTSRTTTTTTTTITGTQSMPIIIEEEEEKPEVEEVTTITQLKTKTKPRKGREPKVRSADSAPERDDGLVRGMAATDAWPPLKELIGAVACAVVAHEALSQQPGTKKRGPETGQFRSLWPVPVQKGAHIEV